MSDEDVTSTIWSRDLTCYKDSDVSEGVCGECGRPVCGDHRRSLRDSTFHYYEGGSRRAVAVLVGLLAVPIVFTQLVPDLVPNLIQTALSRTLLFTDAVVQSAIILAVALALTLRLQSGEHRGDFRVLIRRATDRSLCDNCYEDTVLQRAFYYGVVVVAASLTLIGLRDIVTQGVLLPLRTVAVGLAVWVLRDDIVAYGMHAFEAEKQTVEDATPSREERASTTPSPASPTSESPPSDASQPDNS